MKILAPITPSIIALTLTASLMTGCATKKAMLLTPGQSMTVYAVPMNSGGTQPTCGIAYAGYASYMPTNAWGWSPDTNNTTVFTAADGGGRTDTYVLYTGRMNDRNCGQTTVTIPNPPHSPQYRFCIYFPNNVPTTNYPIILTGFQ